RQEDALLVEAVRRLKRVRRDGNAGLPVRLGARAEHSVDGWGHAESMRGAFDNARAHACVRDALFDVAYEHLSHDLGTTANRPRTSIAEVHREHIPRVQTGTNDDVDL